MKKTHRRLSRRNFLLGSGIVAAGFSLRPFQVLSVEEARLNFYNWDTYIGETTLDDFSASTGIEVKMDIFADNAELFAKMRSGNPGYDLIVPSNDYVPRLALADLLTPLDLSKIPNFENLFTEWRDLSFDPGNRYTVPYFWGTAGIGYRKSKTEGLRIADMKYLLDSDRFSGRIAWMSEASTMFEVAIKYLGFDPEKPTAESIRQAERLLTKQKRHVKAIAEDNGQDMLIAGEVDVCLEWSGDLSQVMEEDDDLGYAIASNGSLRWCDCFAIPKNAPHPENAHGFINYVLGAEVARDIAEYIGYATPNAEAYKIASKEYRQDRTRFPDAKITDSLYFPKYQGEDYLRAVNEAWTRILSSTS